MPTLPSEALLVKVEQAFEESGAYAVVFTTPTASPTRVNCSS